MSKTNNYIIYDFETGGLDCKANPVTSLAMVAIDGATLHEIGELEIFFKPYDNTLVYEETATKVTGLTLDILNEVGDEMHVVRGKLIDFFAKVAEHQVSKNYKPVLVGHNPTFDLGFLQQLKQYAKFPFEKYLDGKLDFNGNYYFTTLDTIQLAHLRYGDDAEMKNYKLGDLIELEGMDAFDAHDAMADVRATKELFKLYINSLRQKGDKEATASNVRVRDYFQF